MISVVMATYNGQKYLEEQLNSIWNQTKRPDEIIISDDASSDLTLQIIEKCIEEKGMPIRVIQNKKRLGYADNFRNALQQAGGEIIFLSDQDDIWGEKKIELCEKFFETHSDALALSTMYQIIDDSGKKIKKGNLFKVVNIRKIKKISWKIFLRHPKYPGMSMAVRKELLDNIDLKNGMEFLAHDWQLNQEAAYQNGMYFWNIELAQYRQHDSNTVGMIMSTTAERAKMQRESMIRDNCERLQTIKNVNESDRRYIEKNVRYQKKRFRLYKDRKYIWLFLYSLLNLKYISMRSILGDLYVGLKDLKTIKGRNV